ncbi:hypothetical protein GCM10010174_91270 [Kutzneria viridogrisea]|uniref:PqqD family protein n=2 Tax=Kutzneria TaxID=43356 RepID=W5W6K2_9PSEU|nr:hypothetical protein [Kutzneria albida]AHH93819.1 hypothetical protein KALB_442 [Kutzneria albida DSM 43870]MBA8931176.1 hypothetical protein [Kutzneria viridogrisea]
MVSFHQLSFVPEGDEVVVGRMGTGSYAVLPADGAALLGRMAEGMAPDHAARWYEDTYGEPVDVEEFLETLDELGFVRHEGEAADSTAGALRWRWLGRALFSPAAWVCFAVLLAAWLVVLAGQPDLLPAPGQIFFTSSVIVVQLVITFGQVPLLFLHEGFHVLAGQRLGLTSQLGMSNRLAYIVFETKLNGVLSVPRAKRYLPFLAGMLCDLLVLACLDLLAAATREADGSLSLAGRLALAMGFTVVMRFAWQFQLFLRTDLYYVFATAFNCYSLHEASKALLRNAFWGLLGRADKLVDESAWTEHDRRVGRWYGPFLVLGVTTALGIAVFASVPVVVEYATTIGGRLVSGRVDAAFWDGAVSLLVNLGQLALLAHLSRRKRRAPIREMT